MILFLMNLKKVILIIKYIYKWIIRFKLNNRFEWTKLLGPILIDSSWLQSSIENEFDLSSSFENEFDPISNDFNCWRDWIENVSTNLNDSDPIIIELIVGKSIY